MRFSTIAALCAAPLALAGTLQQDLVARSIDLDVSASTSDSRGSQKNQDNNKDNDNDNSRKNQGDKNDDKNNKNNKGGNNGNGNNVVIVQQNTINEVIIIWVNNGGGAVTSTVTDTVTVTAGGGGQGTAPPGAVATHQVTVGGAAGLVYSPESIEAAVGDMVIFTFMAQNHTVTQSAFTEPCVKLATGMDSGFMANANNSVAPPPQMAMQVTVATPLWFYCRQKGHCGKGMAFSINPTAAKTQAMFKQMAIAQNGTGAASPITGGTPSGAAPPPPANTAAPPPAAPPAGGAPMVGGQGTIQGGSCSCACLCGTAAFPNSVVQGLGAFGGLSGAMPMSALEA